MPVTNFSLKMDRGRKRHRKLNNLKLVLEKNETLPHSKWPMIGFPIIPIVDYLRHTCNLQ